MKNLPVNKNEIYTFTATDLSVEGYGIGRINGFAVFCPNVLPDETATVKICDVRKTYATAECVEITSPSPLRVAPPCPVFEACGGCSLLHLSYEGQLRYKENHVASCLKNIAGLENIKINPIIPSPDVYGYRNKVQYRFGIVDNKIRCGFYKPRSHEFVPVCDCLVEAEGMKEIRDAFCEFANARSLSIYDETTGKGLLRSLFIRKSFSENAFMVTVVATDMIDDISLQCENVSSIYVNINKKAGNTILSDDFRLVYGDEYLKDKIGDAEFMFGPASFYQVNPKQTERLYATAADYAKTDDNKSVADLFCGIGSIGQFIAKRDGVKKLYGIEYVEEAVKYARLNAEKNGISDYEYAAGDCGKILSGLSGEDEPDLIILDPPRKGCDETVLSEVAKYKQARVLYISCNPATLARDIRKLCEYGFTVKEVTPADMFPQSCHCEVIASITWPTL